MITRLKGRHNLQKNQKGRSMVEMLGVLATIAVLTITSLVGYRYAINKQKATQTISDLTKHALLLSQQAIRKQAVFDLSEAGDKTSLGYPVLAYLLDEPEYFEISITNVPIGVCEQILQSGWTLPLVMVANDLTYTDSASICEQSDENTPANMAFQFYYDLNQDVIPYGKCATDSDCAGSCVKCQDNQCVSTCVGDERCAQDINAGATVCCPADKRSGPYCCPSTLNGWCCRTPSQCCPWFKPLKATDGTCYTCDYTQSVDVVGIEGNCNVCENREILSGKCAPKCPEDKPLRDKWGTCYSCNDPKPIFGTTNCSGICPNRKPNGAYNWYCSIPCKSGTFTVEGGTCASCDDPRTIEVTGVSNDTGCSQCPNRKQYTLNNYLSVCVLECQSGEIRGSDGACYPCDYPNPIYVVRADPYCTNICPNRVPSGYQNRQCSIACKPGTFTSTDGLCYDCDDPKIIYATQVAVNRGCEQCPNRTKYTESVDHSVCILNCPAGEARDRNGTCHSCDDPQSFFINIPQYCTDRCPNRINSGANNLFCSLACGKGSFFDSAGICHACDDPKNHTATAQNCHQCPSERNSYNNTCVLKCPSDTPLKGYDGKCYACDNPGRINVYNMTDSCMECYGERKLDGNFCVLK